MEIPIFIDDIQEFINKNTETDLLNNTFITKDYNWFNLCIESSNIDLLRVEKLKRVGQTKVFYVDLNGNLYNNLYNFLACKDLNIEVLFRFKLYEGDKNV